MSSSKFNKGKDITSGLAHYTAIPRPPSTNNPSTNNQRSRPAIDSSQMAVNNTPHRTVGRSVPEHLNASRNTPLSHKQSSGRSSIRSAPSSNSARLGVSTTATSMRISKSTAEVVENDRDGSSSPIGPLFDEESEHRPENSIGEEQLNSYIRESNIPTTPNVEPARRPSNSDGFEHSSAKRSHTTMMGEENYIVQVD